MWGGGGGGGDFLENIYYGLTFQVTHIIMPSLIFNEL